MLGEQEWPEDEAVYAVEDFISYACAYGVAYAEEWIQAQVPFWEQTFESDALMLRFVAAFNNNMLLTKFKLLNRTEFQLSWNPVQSQLPLDIK